MRIFSNLSLPITALICLLFSALQSGAQTLGGRVLDAEKRAVPYAGVYLHRAQDTVLYRSADTDSLGRFMFRTIEKGTYLVYVKHRRYETRIFSLTVDSARMYRKEYVLDLRFEDIKGAGITALKDPVVQKNDTTEFNASNYKVNRDASAENLVSKMPGITNEGGTIKAQGEEVKKVTVDGQDFFGDDAAAALKNLPAEVVDKVQVFDRKSDQAQFTGVDDGNSQKTLNIVTKNGKNNGQFGKVYGGYGTDERFAAGANVNVFTGKHRISLIGMSNNINQQNFSSQDILGLTGAGAQGGMMRGMGRPGGGPGGYGMGDAGNFMVNQQGGINTTHAFGLNYSRTAGKKLKLSGSYFFNYGKNETSSFYSRTYFLSSVSNQLYQQGDTGTSNNYNHRVNMRLEYAIDSMNSIVFTPQFRVQGNQTENMFRGQTNTQELVKLNNTGSNSNSESNGFNFSQNLLFRHRFKKAGHTISLNLNTVNNVSNGNSGLRSGNDYYLLNDTSSSSFRQKADNTGNSFSFTPNLSYTRPLSKKSSVELTYNPAFSRNNSEKITRRYNDSVQAYSITDSLLSNTFLNTSSTQRAGFTYRYNHKKIQINLGMNAQQTELKGEQSFPELKSLSVPFKNLLPNAMFTYAHSKTSNLRINYRTNTELPSLNQLQNVVNNSNPLILSAGNRELVQEYRHNVFVRYNTSNVSKGRNFFVFARLNTASNYIGNSTTLAASDTVISGISLRRGSQLTMPVNLDGYRSMGTWISYGLPLKKLKSTLNFNLGENLLRSPALINGQTNYSSSLTSNAGVVMASNISEKLDFTLSYSLNYTTVQNTLQSNLNNRYFIQNSNFKFNWMPRPRIVLNADITNSSYNGLGSAFNQSIWLCNGGVGYKFLKDNRGELRLSVFDALRENTAISRTVTESYLEDKNTRILTRFYMLTFTYSIRNFKAKTTEKDARVKEVK